MTRLSAPLQEQLRQTFRRRVSFDEMEMKIQA